MKIFYTQTAVRQLAKLPKLTQLRIAEKMRFYTSQPDPLVFAETLTDCKAYRFRVGDYRVVFEVQGSMMFVLLIKRRDKVYKNL
ncbi:MAG: hypothetical protein CEO19_356 [Parcubacteria group bacterium Gr01-1014_73]|nr:MAG: hypothetical protein CEO19_356 [Parcubacteria group bacterium Gr01-1014_73]